MLSSLKTTLTVLIRKPWIFIPSILGAIASLALFTLVFENLASLILQLIIQEPNLGKNPFLMPMRILQVYPQETLFTLILLLGSLLVSFIVFYFYARYACEYLTVKNLSMTTTAKYTAHKINAIFSAFFFMIFAGILAWTAFYISALASELNAFIGLGIGFIILLALIYLIFKFTFTIPALTDGKTTLKQALQKSWQFTHNRFITVVVLIALSALITFILQQVIQSTLDAIEGDIAYVSIVLLVNAILTAFTTLWISFYYAYHKTETISTEPVTEIAQSKTNPKEEFPEEEEFSEDEDESDTEEENTEPKIEEKIKPSPRKHKH